MYCKAYHSIFSITILYTVAPLLFSSYFDCKNYQNVFSKFRFALNFKFLLTTFTFCLSIFLWLCRICSCSWPKSWTFLFPLESLMLSEGKVRSDLTCVAGLVVRKFRLESLHPLVEIPGKIQALKNYWVTKWQISTDWAGRDMYWPVGGDLVLHPLQLGHRGQQGEVGDGEVGGGHVVWLLQEHVQVVQALLHRVGFPLVRLFPWHELRMLKVTINQN